MNILIIDNARDSKDFGAKDILSLFCSIGYSGCLEVRRAPDQDLPIPFLSSYDAFLISGSSTSVFSNEPWVFPLLDCLQFILTHQIPCLGICYGHQILARAQWGLPSLQKMSVRSIGYKEIEVLDSTSLLKGFPKTFSSFHNHEEEVLTANEMTLLAHSKTISVQAYQIKNDPIFGVQFHFEKNAQNSPQALGKQLLKNFLSYVPYPNTPS